MTVAATTNKITAQGNGAARIFSFGPMVIPDDSSQLKVWTVDDNGVETERLEGGGATNWRISIPVNGYPATGSITFPARSDAAALPANHTIIMRRILDLAQELDISSQGGYRPQTIEKQLDRLVMIAQQLHSRADELAAELAAQDLGTDDIITGVTAGAGLSGGGDEGHVTIRVAEDGVTPAMLDADTTAKKEAILNRIGAEGATPSATETTEGKVRGATNTQADAPSGTTILGWTVNKIRRVIQAALPSMTATEGAGVSEVRRAITPAILASAIFARVVTWARVGDNTVIPSAKTGLPPLTDAAAGKYVRANQAGNAYQLEEGTTSTGSGDDNVQADWGEDDVNDDAYIKNKSIVQRAMEAIRSLVEQNEDKIDSIGGLTDTIGTHADATQEDIDAHYGITLKSAPRAAVDVTDFGISYSTAGVNREILLSVPEGIDIAGIRVVRLVSGSPVYYPNDFTHWIEFTPTHARDHVQYYFLALQSNDNAVGVATEAGDSVTLQIAPVERSYKIGLDSIAQGGATTGQVLAWLGSAYGPSTLNMPDGITAAQVARLLPVFPATGSRDNKIPKFQNDTLRWEEDLAAAAPQEEATVELEVVATITGLVVPNTQNGRTQSTDYILPDDDDIGPNELWAVRFIGEPRESKYRWFNPKGMQTHATAIGATTINSSTVRNAKTAWSDLDSSGFGFDDIAFYRSTHNASENELVFVMQNITSPNLTGIILYKLDISTRAPTKTIHLGNGDLRSATVTGLAANTAAFYASENNVAFPLQFDMSAANTPTGFLAGDGNTGALGQFRLPAGNWLLCAAIRVESDVNDDPASCSLSIRYDGKDRHTQSIWIEGHDSAKQEEGFLSVTGAVISDGTKWLEIRFAARASRPTSDGSRRARLTLKGAHMHGYTQ